MKKIALISVAVLFLLAAYVWAVNYNSKHMTFRQKLLKAFYPALMWMAGKQSEKRVTTHAKANVSFYSLQSVLNDGTVFDFSALKGRKVLLVNTASDCGYTGQYDALQQLAGKYKSKLVILGFPANDFKDQEKGSDEEIAEFCKVNFGVTFPLMKKSSVVKGTEQNSVFRWLSNAAQNGWNNQPPKWNFSKYLVNEQGELTHYFNPAVSPLGKEMIQSIEE